MPIYQRRVYLIRVGGRLVALRRHGHHQRGQFVGRILSAEATPLEHDGVIYYPKGDMGDGRTNLPTYSCHLWSGDDDVIEAMTGMKIEEMGRNHCRP